MAPPGPAPPPGSAMLPVLAWRGWGTALPAAPTTATGPRRPPLRRAGDTDQALGAGRRGTRPRRARAPGAGHATLIPGGRVGASAGERTPHPPRGDRILGLPRQRRTPEGACAAPTSTCGTTGRSVRPPNRHRGPGLPVGLGCAGGAAMPQEQWSVWPGTVEPGLLFLWDTPDSNAARSSPTPKLRRGPHGTDLRLPQNVRCGPSPPAPCWGAGT